MNKEVLIDIRNLKKYFPIKNFFGTSTGNIKAVDDVSFQIYRGETFLIKEREMQIIDFLFMPK